MKILNPEQQKTVEQYFEAAADAARYSICKKARCGSVIVKDGVIISTGFNHPAGGENARCLDEYTIPKDNKHDITCCVHAEVDAVHKALLNNPTALSGSTLYFMRINQDGAMTRAGVPYCTICSKEALDNKISEFVLWSKEGVAVYDTQEYNNVSYQYFKNPDLWLLK